VTCHVAPRRAKRPGGAVNHGFWVHEGPHEPAETLAVRASAWPASRSTICRR